MSIGIVWFRKDLRIGDNPALSAATAECDSVLCAYIDEPGEHAHRPGAASRVWLHHSLGALQGALRAGGGALVVARGEPVATLRALAERTGATRVYWNRRHDPDSVATDKRVKSALSALSPRTFNASLLFEPWEALKKDGTPYRVYTPYWRAVAARLGVGEGLDLPARPTGHGDAARLAALARQGFSGDIESLRLLPREPWHVDMIAGWEVGEAGARRRLDTFLDGEVARYATGRNLPGIDGTSRLSPHLHHGELSPRRVVVETLRGRSPEALGGDELSFVKEIVWREFSAMLLYHYPDTRRAPLDRRFERFPWADELGDEPTARGLEAWRRGRTGVPIVDAGMRQLYATGWMHNRVRMIVASYLVKNLLVRWQAGEAWFRDCLVDADVASNAAGWQWVAGSGADAAPFFRVFNPVLQGGKFDADGAYVRRWVPEIAGVSGKRVHAPWELPVPPADYPAPLVDLGASRQRALDAFATLRRAPAD